MIWIDFTTYYTLTIALWIVSLASIWMLKGSKSFYFGLLFAILGTLSLVLFTFLLWQELQRPPLRTLGETRLWYSLFLPLIGILTFVRWRYKWFISYSLILASVFLTINLLNPETYSRTLMPALQSPLFVPHVVVYLFAYATLAASSIVAVKGLISKTAKPDSVNLADNLVYIGFSFLSFGLIFGAIWAKEAWGHYWTWDPKETWAFLTWMGYLIYIHYRHSKPKELRSALWILSLAFVVLLICWFGVNYLPTTNYSVHTYTKY